jgi:small subunit ribosomal protein S18
MQNFELYFILNPILGNEAFATESNKIKELLETRLSAQDIVVSIEGVKKLAYPINKSWTGCYVSIKFNLVDGSQTQIGVVEKALNINTNIFRYMFENQTEFLVQLSKQKLNETATTNHRELNKKANAHTQEKKKCIVKHVGYRVIDYKNVEFLEQFMSPYAKIFSRERTGVSAKYQRKITKAIKRARHMGFLPFTAKHMA